MIAENLSTLKIHKLTKEQYERELAAGRIDENALYLTPDEEIDLSGYATKDEVEAAIESIEAADVGAAPSTHTHTKSQITDFPSLATVATSGNYNDLTGKPTIPTIPTSLKNPTSLTI